MAAFRTGRTGQRAVGKYLVYHKESEIVPLEQRFNKKMVGNKIGKWAEVRLWKDFTFPTKAFGCLISG